MINEKMQDDNLLREIAEKIETMPPLKFDKDLDVYIIPPFSMATARFYVKKGDAYCSVYLDCFDSLGFMGESYYEVYSRFYGNINNYEDDDDFEEPTIKRFMATQTTQMMKHIRWSIDCQVNGSFKIKRGDRND